MKTLRLVGMVLFAVLMCVNFASCSSEEDENFPTPEKSNTYEISLSLGGEYIEVSEKPLSRVDETPQKYYAVKVLCMKTDGSQSSYGEFAGGLFDNVENMKITLLGGYKYKFICTSITEGLQKIKSDDIYIYWPTSYGYYKSNLNKFLMEGFFYFNDNFLKYCDIESTPSNRSGTYKYPAMDRFYGELSDFLPTESTATIPMKRTAFGLNLKINGVPDGQLSWNASIDNDGLYFSSPNHTGEEIIEKSSIYTFHEVYNCWNSEDNFTKTIKISFTWKRSNGYEQEFSKEIVAKRNVMTTVNITLTGGNQAVKIGINDESTKMSDETIDVSFDGGSLSDTNANPTE